MGQAVRPFLEYLVLQMAVTIVGLNVVRESKLGISGCIKSWIFGQMLCLAILQIMAVPMILLKWHFSALFWTYLGVCCVLFGVGVWRLRCRTRIGIHLPELNMMEFLLLIVTMLLILWQSTTYFFGIHLDEDDARFVVQANDALEYGQMLTRFFENGEYLGQVEPIRDVTSPWTMFLAIISKMLFTKPAIFAHTIYPPVELFTVYGIYWLIARELFEKQGSKLSCVFLAALVNMFFTTTVYTQSTFTMVRIWQGKASVAAVIVPMLFFLFICINRKELNNQKNTELWLMVFLTGSTACLMSGAGIPLSLVAIVILGFYNVVVYQQWKKIPLWVASMITPLSSGILYMFLRG